MKKVYLLSTNIQCRPSAILSSRIAKYIQCNDYILTREIDQADYVIVNTCGFDLVREETSIRRIKEILEHKKDDARMLSVGCLNKINRQRLEDSYSDIEIIDDLTDFDGILKHEKNFESVREAYYDEELLSQLPAFDKINNVYTVVKWLGAKALYKLFKNVGYPRFEAVHYRQMLEECEVAGKVFVQIGTGCSGSCAYCAIKFAKGNPHSRPIDDILSDLREVYVPGKNISLVADDCASYGLDTGDTLFELVRRISMDFPEAALEFCYINPYWLQKQADQYLNMIQTSNINFINIPIQSGSDSVIRKMNRHYDIDTVLGLVDQIKKVSPDTLIWNQVMTGYPGETWSDYKKTISAVKHFHASSVFYYSPRIGTASSKMEDGPSRGAAKIRRWILIVAIMLNIARELFSFSKQEQNPETKLLEKKNNL